MLTPKQDLDAALHAEKEWKQKKVMEAIAALHFITNVKDIEKHLNAETGITINKLLPMLTHDCAGITI